MSLRNIYAGLKLITPPAVELMTVDEAASYLAVTLDGSATDVDVSNYLVTTRAHVEMALRRGLIQQTWKLSMVNWPGRDYLNWPQAFSSQIDQYYHTNFIKLPMAGPLISVTSVTYMTSDGTIKSMSPANFTTSVPNGYNVWTNMEPGRIALPFAQVWPTDILMPGAPIDIIYVVGHATMADLQNWEGYGPTMQVIKLLLVDCWENRIPPIESQLNQRIAEWLAPYRIYDAA